MAHIHEVKDSDSRFVIDPDSRVIYNESGENLILMQYDHNSTMVTFEVPKTVDGHDMTLCDRVQIHFVNIGSNSRSSGVYETKLVVDPENNDVLLCTWLISSDATMYPGTLNFSIRFICTSGETIEYIWSTSIYKDAVVYNGIYNSDIQPTYSSEIGIPIIVTTAEEMESILESATSINYDKIYQYTGPSTDAYEQGAYYVLLEE